ncbi:hypothetical protein DITRI_Ditri01bG0088300 [Diplodiscus trichospermus]
MVTMSTRGWFASYKLRKCIELLLHPYNYTSGNIYRGFQHQDVMAKRHDFPMNQGLRFISTNRGIWKKLDPDITSKKDERAKDSPPAAGSGSGSGPPKFNFSLWVRYLLGSVLCFFMPSWKEKWEKLKRIEGEAEMVVEEVENVAEVVEKVATAAENVSAQLAEKLPDDGKLKKAALVVEHVSEITAQDAHATTQFIHQVEATKHDLDGLESLVEPIVNKLVKQGGQGK